MSLKLYNSSYKLGEICLQITDGKHGDCENQENSGYYFVSVKDIDDGEINYSNARQITKFDFEDTDRRTKLENEDILITNSGTIGKFVFVNSPLSRKTTFQKSVAIIKPNKNKIIPKFLYYYLISEKRQLVEYAGGTTQKNLLLRDIRNFEVKIPDESRQKKIIMILNDIDQLISVNKKLNKNLDELCHSLFKYYFIDFIPFCDDDFIDSDIGEIPKEWSITTVGNILDCKLGGTPSRSNESYWGGSIAWINSGKVNDFRIIEPSEYITEKGLKKSATKLLPAKTTVIAITGATLGQISLLEIDSCANQSVIGIIPNINYPYEFVYPLISSILIDLLKHQTGGAQQHINKNNVESFKIICPPAEIISEYKTIVSPIYSKISDNCFEIEKLQKLRDTLLPKLMSGEIDVSKINCDLELKYNYMKYLFNQIHTPMSKSVV